MTSSRLDHFIAGALAGSASVFVGHPFDTMKVQLQLQQVENKYKGMMDCFTTIRKQGMVRGFFRGMSWPFLAYGIVNSVFFGVYGSVLKYLDGDRGREGPNYMHIYLAGCISGVLQLIPSCPCEVIKVVLQSQIPHQVGTEIKPSQKFYKGPIEGSMDIIRKRGFLGMYRGFSINAIRDLPANGVYFLVFEYMSYEGRKLFSESPTQLIDFFSGGVAGVLSWAVIIPFDVIKSRMQADSEGKQYRNMFDCAAKSYQKEGLGVFFRGLTVTSIRAFPVNAVILMVYMDSLKLLNFWRSKSVE